MTDASIPLQVQTPNQVSPLATMGGLMQMRAHLGQIALQQAEAERARANTADITAQAKQRERDLAATNTLTEVLKDPASHAKFAAGDYSPLFEKGIAPQIANPEISALQGLREKALSLQKGKADFYAQGRDLLAQTLEGLDPKDDTRAADQFNGAITTLAATHPELAQQLQPLTPGPTFRDTLGNLAATNSISRQMLLHKAALDKETAATAESTAKAGEANAQADLHKAQTPGATAESEKKQLVTQAMRDALADPTQGAAAIQAILPNDPEAAKGYIAAHNAAMVAGSPEAAARIVEAAAQHATSLSSATRAAHVQTAVETARAELPIHVAAEVQKQLAIAKLSPDSFSTITNPTARASAMTNYEKDSKEYAGKISDAKRIQDFVAAAQSGNKAAPGLIPLTELRGLVNRVNRNELEAVSGAGNLLDKISGKLGSLTEGQPIPPDILADTAKIADTMAGAARRDYELKVQVNNKTYGGNVKPIDFTPTSIPAPTSSAPKFKAGDMVMYQGKPHKVAGYDAQGKLLIDPQ